jgi:hypothetical protein
VPAIVVQMDRLLDQGGNANEKGWNQLNTGYEVYSYRWIILFTFILSGVANAFVLLTWAPITDKAQTYWDEIDITAINLLSVIFQICYVPGTFLSLYFSSNYSMYSSLIAGSLLTAVGCFVRYVGVLIRDNAGAHTSYAVVFVGTTLVALAQPVYLNMPAKIASIWFATYERDASSVLGSLSYPLGSAIGSFIPGMLVSDSSLSSIKHGIQTTLMVQMIFSFVSLGASIFLFRERPPTPPSATAENTADDRANSPSVFEYFGTLLTNPEYLKILIPFTIILANLNAVAALLNQLPTNYSSGQIGITGAALIMGGFIASLAIGYILDYTKAHLFLIRLLYVLTFISWTFFMTSSRNNLFPMFIIAAICLGASTLSTVSTTMIVSVEVSYPIPADAAVGLLYMFANTTAIAMTFIGQVLLASSSTAPAPFFPYGIFIIALFGFSLIPIAFFKGTFQRMMHET